MQMINCLQNSRRLTGGTRDSVTYDSEACGRHILVFGKEMQERISQLTIGICSLGGLGMLLLEQLMRLYPGKLIVVDHDRVSRSNLNRLTGSTYLDANLDIPKAQLAARHVWSFNPKQELTVVEGDFLELKQQEQFRECDVIFSAFDRIGPRLAANQLCEIHGITLFDVGVGAVVKDGTLQAAGGQVIRVVPGAGFCLSCADIYDKAEAAADFMDMREYQNHLQMGYVRGANIAAPQVYALNMMTASWAVWMFMRLLAGDHCDFDGVAVDAFDWTAAPWLEERKSVNTCPICGNNGMALTGDDGTLLVHRRDVSPNPPTSIQDPILDRDRQRHAESPANLTVPTDSQEIPKPEEDGSDSEINELPI